jgi:hypothetical protein
LGLAPRCSVRSGTTAARHKPFHRFALREHLPMSTLDGIDARIEPRTGRGQTNAEDLAMASTHTGLPELSPERVPREGAADASSAERNRKQKRIVEDDSTGEEENAVTM